MAEQAIKLRRLSAGHYQCRDYPTVFVDFCPKAETFSGDADTWYIVVNDETVNSSDTLREARWVVEHQIIPDYFPKNWRADRPRPFRSLRAIRAAEDATRRQGLVADLCKLAERAQRTALAPEAFGAFTDIFQPLSAHVDEATVWVKFFNHDALALFAGQSSSDDGNSWAVGWIFPRGVTEEQAVEWLMLKEGITVDGNLLDASNPGEGFEQAVWFERRPSGRLFARQSGGHDV